jgi:hypothetical protein
MEIEKLNEAVELDKLLRVVEYELQTFDAKTFITSHRLIDISTEIDEFDKAVKWKLHLLREDTLRKIEEL